MSTIFHDIQKQSVGVLTCLGIGALIGFVLWCFAYFGWTNLGLPQHFNYENLNHLVRSNLPKGYIYSTYEVGLHTSSEDSLLIVGSDEDKGNPNKNSESDILLIVDKARDEYKISYKYQPLSEYSIDSYTTLVGSPNHVNGIRIGDVNNDGRDEIIIGLSHLGANYSDPSIIVIGSNGEKISVLGVPNYKGYDNKLGIARLVNHFDNMIVETVVANVFELKKSQIALIYRTDDKCRACSEEGVFSVRFFNVFKNRVVTGLGNTDDIKGYDSLQKFLNK